MEEQPPPPRRRRSSVAYDPARDIFTEIPDTVPENAVLDSPESVARPKRADAEAKGRTSSPNRSPRSSPRPAPRTVLDLPKVSKRPREEGEAFESGNTASAYSRRPDNRNSDRRRRSRSPGRQRDRDRERDNGRDRNREGGVYSRRSPPRRRPTPERDPSPIRRSPTRRQVHRPGGREGRGRIIDLDQIKRERESRQGRGPAAGPSSTGPNRGVQEASNQFYNERPDWFKTHGREWRKNESQIKGLRSFNNFIKSVLIQKFSPEFNDEEAAWGQEDKPEDVQQDPIRVLDIGCGKGGDLGKWDKLPTPVELYVGLDPAATSIQQASQRYTEMSRRRDRQAPLYDGRFFVQDCFGESIANLKIINTVGFDPNVGDGTIRRFGGGGFDVVTMMFSMHYAFESEEKVRIMLKNVAGSLKKGGRFIGVVPNSDALADHINKWFARKDNSAGNSHNGSRGAGEGDDNNNDDDPSSPAAAEAPHWGNSIYSVRFPPPEPPYVLRPPPAPSSSANEAIPSSSSVAFRPAFGWKYTYWMAEAVDVPEFVVPWEAFRALAESYNLEQRYRKGFLSIWEEEKYKEDMWNLGARMGVVDKSAGQVRALPPGDPSVHLAMSEEEKEAVGFYHAFCFVKV
ncbi:hypothetical protein DV735_g5454, partial [Chaetothyriales sp. CBS 134920]